MANTTPSSLTGGSIRIERPIIRVTRGSENVSRVIRIKIDRVLPPPPPPPVVESQVLERDGFDLGNIYQRQMSDRFNQMKPRIEDYFDRLWSALEAEGLTEVPEGEKRYQTFLIDNSGSMRGTNNEIMEFVSIFLALLSEKLKEPIALFSYSDDTICISDWPDVASGEFSRPGMPAAIMLGIRPTGGTAPVKAFSVAQTSLDNFLLQNPTYTGHEGRIVCFTDGDFSGLESNMLRDVDDHLAYSLVGQGTSAEQLFGSDKSVALDVYDEERMIIQILQAFLPPSFLDKINLSEVFKKDESSPDIEQIEGQIEEEDDQLTGWRSKIARYPFLRKIFGLKEPRTAASHPQNAQRLSRSSLNHTPRRRRATLPPPPLNTQQTPPSPPTSSESTIRISREVVEGDEIEKMGIPLLPYLDESEGIYIGHDGRKYRLSGPYNYIDINDIPAIESALRTHGKHGIRYLDSTPRKLVFAFKEAHEIPRDRIPLWDSLDLESWENHGKIEFPSFADSAFFREERPGLTYFSDGFGTRTVGSNTENLRIEDVMRVREKDENGNEVYRIYNKPRVMSTLGEAQWFENITNTEEYARTVSSDHLGGQHDFTPVTREIMQKADEIRAQFPGDITDPVVQENRIQAAYDFVKSFTYTPGVGNYYKELDTYYKKMSQRGLFKKIVSKAPKKPTPVDPLRKDQSGYVTFGNKEGVCAGYAKSLLMLLSFLQVPDVTYVTGIAPPSYIIKPNTGWTEEQRSEYAHAWIKIGNRHYDPTFDNQHADSANFFGLSDAEIKQQYNREWK